jgi:hypothetical protein
MIPHKLTHVIDCAKSLPCAISWLLHAGELHFVVKYTPATDDYFSFQVASLQLVAVESIIQNVLDVGVVFWFRTPPSQNTRHVSVRGAKQ